MSMRAVAHRGCTDTVRESALKVDSGSRTRVSNALGLCLVTQPSLRVHSGVSVLSHRPSLVIFLVSVSSHSPSLVFFLVSFLSHSPSLVFFLVSVSCHTAPA